ncbi:MAG: lysylphosphatidylglycerol synthase transmembrane domain-containing protein [Calditrichia bacterium]
MVLNKKSYKKLFQLLKLVVTVALCGFILWKIDWKGLDDAAESINFILLMAVFLAMVLNVFLSTLKWKILLAIHGIQFRFSVLYKYYFTAAFFNNFLPSTIGGDGYRIFKTFRNPESKEGAVTTVIVERITGILALLFLGFVGSIVIFLRNGDVIARDIMFTGTIGIGIFLVCFPLIVFKADLFRKLTGKYLPGKIKRVIAHTQDYQHNLSKTLLVILLSLLFQSFLLVYRLLLIYTVGESISIFSLAVVVAVSTVIALIPISINGIGLMDGSYIYLLVHYGVGYDQAVIVMLLIRLLQLPLSLVGGIFYQLDKSLLKVPDVQPEEI